MSWKIADIIDFEWFLAEDADVDEPMLRARDREIFAQISRGCLTERGSLKPPGRFSGPGSKRGEAGPAKPWRLFSDGMADLEPFFRPWPAVRWDERRRGGFADLQGR